MSDIKPMSAIEIPYERAIGLPPCLELDMFVWHNVLEGPEEALANDKIGHLPALSRRYGDGQLCLLMAVHELGRLTVDVDPNLFDTAKDAGFIIRKRPCIVWRVASEKHIGYGRSFEEALCKLLIVAKYAKS